LTPRPFSAVLIAAVAAAALTGCGLLGSTSDSTTSAAQPTPATEAPAPTGSASSGLGDSVKDAGVIPDPCTLLSESEVKELTGRDITQIDEDGVEPGETARFCQWQQAGGQLAVFLSRTTPADYELTIEEATPVDGLGEKAFDLAGHLYVLYGTVQVDVYSRGDSDEENLAKARKVVNVLLPKI
jgi:hypothetical protein